MGNNQKTHAKQGAVVHQFYQARPSSGPRPLKTGVADMDPERPPRIFSFPTSGQKTSKTQAQASTTKSTSSAVAWGETHEKVLQFFSSPGQNMAAEQGTLLGNVQGRAGRASSEKEPLQFEEMLTSIERIHGNCMRGREKHMLNSSKCSKSACSAHGPASEIRRFRKETQDCKQAPPVPGAVLKKVPAGHRGAAVRVRPGGATRPRCTRGPCRSPPRAAPPRPRGAPARARSAGRSGARSRRRSSRSSPSWRSKAAPSRCRGSARP